MRDMYSTEERLLYCVVFRITSETNIPRFAYLLLVTGRSLLYRDSQGVSAMKRLFFQRAE